MLIEDVTIDAKVEKRDRNWMIRIYSALEQSPDVQIECHREIILAKDGVKWDTCGQNGERKYMITKMLSEIATDEVTLPIEYGGITLNGAQIALALEMLSDKYAESKPE
jgi:hypothetical protein